MKDLAKENKHTFDVIEKVNQLRNGMYSQREELRNDLYPMMR